MGQTTLSGMVVPGFPAPAGTTYLKLPEMTIYRQIAPAPEIVWIPIAGGAGQYDTLVPPQIAMLDPATAEIGFKNPSGLQIEVWRYTRHRQGPHVNRSAHLGKRYKPFMWLPLGAMFWTLPPVWRTKSRRVYLKFGVRAPDGRRSTLGVETVVVHTLAEYDVSPAYLTLLG